MKLLAKENGCALFLNADEIHFVEYKAANITVVFVSSLLGGIFLAGGIAQLFTTNLSIASIFIPLGLAGLYFGYWLKAKNKISNDLTPTAHNTILMVDTCEREVYSGKRIHYGNMQECGFRYAFQMTSSAKALVFEHPTGKIPIVKGNPFGGSNKPFYAELKRYDLI